MKEARPANMRSLLLSALILSSFTFQAQAYYHPDEGRWLSRDPIGEEAFMRLHEEDVKRELVDYRGTDTDNNGIRVVQDVISLMDVLLATSPNLYEGFLNAPVNRVDAVGLKCKIYLMMGHFGGKDADDKGWLWTQLGTSTAKLGECDGVYSISCHMKSFVDMAGSKVSGVVTLKGWPPSPYDDDRKINCTDVPTLYGQTESMNKSMADALKKDAKCCCKEVKFHVMCDEDMKACTKKLVENKKKGIIKPSLDSDPCGLDKEY